MSGSAIAVGVDGSQESRAALRWALDEARLRRSHLNVLYAWYGYSGTAFGAPGAVEDWEVMRRAAEEYVEAFVAESIGSPADVRVSVAAVHGVAAQVLIAASEHAAVLVVGSRGRGGLRGLLGSVSHECAQHAHCPVVILRGFEVETRTVEELEEVAGNAR